MSPPFDAVVAFYSGGTDHRGRTLEEILAWDDERLERVHDYIQCVFPTREPSGVNPHAPLVTDTTVLAFRESDLLRDRLRAAFQRMLRFYGLQSNGAAVESHPLRFAARARVWLQPGNHNHLRLTRMIASLATLGLGEEAKALQHCLIEQVAAQHGGVSARTLEFWKEAV